jgi:ankyrin repeat protein
MNRLPIIRCMRRLLCLELLNPLTWFTFLLLASTAVAQPPSQMPPVVEEAKLGMPLTEFLKLTSADGFQRKDSFGGGHQWLPRIEMTKEFPEYGIPKLTLYFSGTDEQRFYMSRTLFENEEQAGATAHRFFGAPNDGPQWRFNRSKDREFTAWVYGPYMVVLMAVDGTQTEISTGKPKSENLVSAVESGNLVRVIEILKAQPDLLTEADPLNRTPLMIATQAASSWDPDVQRYTEIVRYLIAKGADPNKVGYEGRTPLHNALRSAPRELIEALLAGGADKSIKDDNSLTPWRLALALDLDYDRLDLLSEILEDPGYLETARAGRLKLLEERLDSEPSLLLSRTDEGLSALHLASLCGSPRFFEGVTPATEERYLPVVKALLVRGIDVNVRAEKTNVTPLHLACQIGSVPVVQELLEAGADPDAKDSDGSYPADYVGRTILTQPVADQIWKLLGEEGRAPTSRVTNEDSLVHCKENLSNLVVAHLIFLEDEGRLPETFDLLIGNYLSKLPKCFASPDSKYTLEMQGTEFVIRCSETHGLPERPSNSSAD